MRKKTQKKIEAFNQKNKQDLDDMQQQIDAAIETTLTIADAGERYLNLAAIESQLETAQKLSGSKFIKQEQDLSQPIATTSTGLTITGLLGMGGAVLVALGTGTVAAVTVPSLLITFAAGISLFTTGLVMGKRNLKVQHLDISHDVSDFYQITRSLQKKLRLHQNDLLQNHLAEISTSPRGDDLCKQFPAVKDAFTQAAKESLRPMTVKLDKPKLQKKPAAC